MDFSIFSLVRSLLHASFFIRKDLYDKLELVLEYLLA